MKTELVTFMIAQLIASLEIGKIGLLVINLVEVVVSTELERLRHLLDMVENFAKAMPRKYKFVTRNHVQLTVFGTNGTSGNNAVSLVVVESRQGQGISNSMPN